MIYLFQDDIKQLINQRILPLMKKQAFEAAVHAGMDAAGTVAYARGIFETYHYGKRNEVRLPLEDPFGELDFTAFWFLLFPYETDNGNPVAPDQGAIRLIVDHRGLTEKQIRSLSFIRTLRNDLEHNTPKHRCILPAHRDLFYVDEEKVFRYIYREAEDSEGQKIIHDDISDLIADAAAPLEPEIYLYAESVKNTIHKKLNERAAAAGSRSTVSADSDRFQAYIAPVLAWRERHRSDIQHFDQFAWFRAPIGMPLEGKAPWADLNDDLENLPWPSRTGGQNA
ncbi:MAG: hypothetical protein IKD88_06590 [Lachnospiraceae bacterium]|nr:hypothetical protein [Lachnospiraceae bacterium]